MKLAAAAPKVKTKAPKYIPVDQIDIIPDIRIRCKVREATVDEYKEAMEEGIDFPPGVAFTNSDGRHILADGEHRMLARIARNEEKIPLIIYDDDPEAAQSLALEYALQANGRHGLKLSINDRHNAVKIALADKRIRRFADKRIAELVGVSPGLVAKLRTGEPEEKKPRNVSVGAHKRTAPGSTDPDSDPAETEEDSIEVRTRTIKAWIKEDKLDWQTCLEVLDASYKDATFFRLPKKDGKIIVIRDGKESEVAVKEATFKRGRITLFVDSQ